jgi:hypothetical protein
MRKKPKTIDFDEESRKEIEAIKSKIGKEVPLSRRYTQGARALLVSIDGETATIRFPNGATLSLVPVRDLVDDGGYWRSECIADRDVNS